MLSLILAAVGAVAALLLFFGARLVLARESDLNARLDQVMARNPSLWRQPNLRSSSLTSGLDKAVSGRSFAGGIQRDLARANLKITVTEYFLIHGLLMLLVGLVTYLLSGNLLGSVITGMVSMPSAAASGESPRRSGVPACSPCR